MQVCDANETGCLRLATKEGFLAGAAWCVVRGVVSQGRRTGGQMEGLIVYLQGGLCRNDHSSVAAATMLRRGKRTLGCRCAGSTPHQPESSGGRSERVPLVLSLQGTYNIHQPPRARVLSGACRSRLIPTHSALFRSAQESVRRANIYDGHSVI